MIKYESNVFGKTLFIIYPGEYFATGEDCIIGSVVGACVAMCMYDNVRRIGGICNFIVPGSIGTNGIISSNIAQHGISSIERLIGEIVKLGGDRKYLKAKIFGAGYQTSEHTPAELIDANIQFIHEYFALEKILVERNDLGGKFRRKIYFYPVTGVVYRNILKNNEIFSEFIQLEKEYINMLINNKEVFGKMIIFE